MWLQCQGQINMCSSRFICVFSWIRQRFKVKTKGPWKVEKLGSSKASHKSATDHIFSSCLYLTIPRRMCASPTLFVFLPFHQFSDWLTNESLFSQNKRADSKHHKLYGLNIIIIIKSFFIRENLREAVLSRTETFGIRNQKDSRKVGSKVLAVIHFQFLLLKLNTIFLVSREYLLSADPYYIRCWDKPIENALQFEKLLLL